MSPELSQKVGHSRAFTVAKKLALVSPAVPTSGTALAIAELNNGNGDYAQHDKGVTGGQLLCQQSYLHPSDCGRPDPPEHSAAPTVVCAIFVYPIFRILDLFGMAVRGPMIMLY